MKMISRYSSLRRMLPSRNTIACAVVGVAGLGMVAATTDATLNKSTAEAMQESARSFVEILNDAEKEIAVLDYETPQRVGWHFVPMKTRKGLALRDMTEAQRTAALRLLRAALSESGYSKASQIMLMEQVLRALEGPNRTWDRDWQMYYVTLFGNPMASDQKWGFSFEGHHLSMNFVCQGTKVLDSTPQFFAANPAVLKSDVPGAPLKQGTRILADEELVAFELVGSLSEEQKGRAIIAPEALAEIRDAGSPQPSTETPKGLAHREMTKEQIALLEELIAVYVSSMTAEVAENRIAAIEEAGWDKVHFAWAGATEPGIGHYYRIQGPSFLIEFVNTQPDAEGNPANHIHCVWRDMTGDFDLPVAAK